MVSEEAQAGVSQQGGEAMIARLRSVPVLASLGEDELRCMVDGAEIRVRPGEYIAKQGEQPNYFWILLSGEMRISQSQPDGREHLLTTLPAGTAFGELPLLANVPNGGNVIASEESELLRFDEQKFWVLMTVCPGVRRAVLGNMAMRFQKYQSIVAQQEKMASLGTLAAGLMHELNNPGTAAIRAASQLRENLLRMHKLTAKFSKSHLSDDQKGCIFQLQEYALAKAKPAPMNSLDQSDAEEALAAWMETAEVEDSWRLAPTLVSMGITADDLKCARDVFPGPEFSDALSWLEALVSSLQLVGTIEESVGRVSDLVKAVKSYAYEGKGKKQTININESIHATLVILAHKMREKQITLEKDFGADLAPLQSDCSGLNQVWTNLLDNAIDAVEQHGRIRIRTWAEESPGKDGQMRPYLCITIADNGPGISGEIQPHIFDPFYTTKAAGVGTGLGLGIVQRIVEQYGGTVNFSSEPGNTEFHVKLPQSRS